MYESYYKKIRIGSRTGGKRGSPEGGLGTTDDDAGALLYDGRGSFSRLLDPLIVFSALDLIG